jgi:hypothetical protein
MAFLPGALAALTLVLLPPHSSLVLTEDTAQTRLDRLEQRVRTVCRRANRHGAMAAQGTRLCIRDTLDRAVSASGDACLQAVHARAPLSVRQASCDNATRTAAVHPQERHEHDRDS